MRHAPLKRDKTPTLVQPLEPATDVREQATDLPALVHEAVTSTGQPLEAKTRTSMERRFGHSFADVRVHSDDRAARSSELLNANAYTVAPNIVFGPSKYQPTVAEGRRLIAHELTHVVQQRSGPVANTPLTDGLALSEPGDPFERGAQSMAADITGERIETPESQGALRSAAAPSRFAYPGNSANGSLVLQRDPITLNPVVISNDPSRQADLQQKSDAMMNRFPEVWRGFCRDWQIASTTALASVPDPPNPYEARNFWVALAGNMAWAMTSISVVGATGGVGAAAVVGVSAAGAGAGSGALAKSGPPSGRGQAATVLTAQKDKMETLGTRSMFADVALASMEMEQAEQDDALWKKFAPAIPFASRASVMLANAQRRLTSWFAQFQSQYIAWKEREDVISKARDYELGEISSEPFGDPISAIADMIGVGTPADRFFEQAQADIPFTPTFSD